MSLTFCTIITVDYLHYALALYKSLVKYGTKVKLYILIPDSMENIKTEIENKYPDIFILDPVELCSKGIGKKIYTKYYNVDMNAFRWSMKPVLINYLLDDQNFEKVFYLDADLYFVNDYQFLVDELNIYNLLLTCHYRSCDPHKDLFNFERLYTEGIYNGGFIGANKNAIPAMNWWAMVCEFVCIDNKTKGMYYDQIHLNYFPAYFDKVGIIKHKGCNVANWNMVESKRSLAADNRTVLIANEFPVIFIHFSKTTINGIIDGSDPLLVSYLEDYYIVLNQYSMEFGINSEKKNPSETKNINYKKEDNQRNPNQEKDVSFDIPITKETLDQFYVRTRIFNSIKTAIQSFQGNLLDISTPEYSYKKYIHQNSSITGYVNLDLQNPWTEVDDGKGGFNWDGISIPFMNEEFNTVLGLEVLDHYSKPEIIVKEANRVLRKGGNFIFTVSYLSPLNNGIENKFRYTVYSLKRLFEEAGFVNVDINGMGGWHASMAQMLGLWVRRSPISPKKKKMLFLVLKPIIKYLLKIDKFTKIDFSKSQMVTGLIGIAYKSA